VSFERFCLTAGIATLAEMMENDAAGLCGVRYGRADSKDRYRWGRTKGKLGFHGGKIELERPRVRARDGGEIGLPSWQAAVAEDWLGQWALNLMLINVSTRKFGRAVRLPECGVPAGKGTGLFQVGGVASLHRPLGRTHARVGGFRPIEAGPAGDPDRRIHIAEDLVLLAAVGVDGVGDKHPLAENSDYRRQRFAVGRCLFIL
jgi:putative transposase